MRGLTASSLWTLLLAKTKLFVFVGVLDEMLRFRREIASNRWQIGVPGKEDHLKIMKERRMKIFTTDFIEKNHFFSEQISIVMKFDKAESSEVFARIEFLASIFSIQIITINSK